MKNHKSYLDQFCCQTSFKPETEILVNLFIKFMAANNELYNF